MKRNQKNKYVPKCFNLLKNNDENYFKKKRIFFIIN